MPVQRRRIGVISNPRSHAYRAGLRDAISDHLRPEVAEPATMGELLETLERFAADAVDLVIVHGGDGTLRDVLTLLPIAYPDGPPELAILAAGNTNLAARVFGRIRPGARGLVRFLRAAQAGRLRRSVCRTLQVAWPDAPDRPPVRGFFLGAGLYAQGKRIADAEIHRRGLHRGPAVGLAVAASLLRILGRGGAELRRGTRVRIAPDGQVPREGRSLVFLATTLDRLMLGFWPFRGSGEGAIRWMDMEAPPRRIVRMLVAVLLRRPWRGGATHGHHSGRTTRLTLRLDQPFVLDGEFFAPYPDDPQPGTGRTAGRGHIVLSSGDPVTIVRP